MEKKIKNRNSLAIANERTKAYKQSGSKRQKRPNTVLGELDSKTGIAKEYTVNPTTPAPHLPDSECSTDVHLGIFAIDKRGSYELGPDSEPVSRGCLPTCDLLMTSYDVVSLALRENLCNDQIYGRGGKKKSIALSQKNFRGARSTRKAVAPHTFSRQVSPYDAIAAIRFGEIHDKQYWRASGP
jgi:hypothetical protein